MVMAPSEKIRKKESGTKERQILYSLCTFTLNCEQSTLYMKYRGMFLFHLDSPSVLVENRPLVKFIWNCIRDSSGIFFFYILTRFKVTCISSMSSLLQSPKR